MNHKMALEHRFEELFKNNYMSLFNYAFDWVGDEEIAKDLISELFSDIWAQYDNWSPENEAAYLYRSIRNRCINYLKHQSVERNRMQGYVKENSIDLCTSFLLHERQMECVENVMQTLPDKTRFIVEQCYMGGKKYSELAELLNTSSGMIHKHISKALMLFRKALKEINDQNNEN